MEDPLPNILIILGLLLLAGLLTLTEKALAGARKPRLRVLAEGGDKNYRRALEAAENPGPYLLAARIWFVLLSVMAGVLGGRKLIRWPEAWFQQWEYLAPYEGEIAGVLVIAGITVVAVFLGDILPKQFAPLAPEAIIATLFPLIRCFTFLSHPLIRLSSRLSALFAGIFHPDQASGMTEDELRIALMEGEKSGIVESKERTMVEGVFYLGDRPVETFMIHRSEIIWLDINADKEAIRAGVIKNRNQRYFPVADGTLDQVIGVAYLEDILLAFLEDSWRGLRAVMREPRFVPATMSALKAFEAFKGREEYIFVMDEYGGFAGSLSVRDLVEGIVGQLSAPAPEEAAILPQEDGTWLADGSVNIDELARTISLSRLTEEHRNGHPEYHTLAGFILDLAGEIPKTGAGFDYSGFRFKIVDMDGNRIDKVMIRPIREGEPG
ncbi:MAG: hemolysin family protein [Treponema sp.]|jgi:putative hemolysin|nr:hemolysin family protein [Treponema sp.]